MRKSPLSFLVLVMVLFLAGCTTTNFSTNMIGWSDHASVIVKDFDARGIVIVTSQEVHRAGPLGFTRSVEGGKVTYTDLIQAAINLSADDIINVRIDVHSNYRTTLVDWFTGWVRTYTYTGTALAIKYTDKADITAADAHLAPIPKGQETLKGR